MGLMSGSGPGVMVKADDSCKPDVCHDFFTQCDTSDLQLTAKTDDPTLKRN